MLKFAQRTIVVLSVTMLAGAPVAMADTKPPTKPTKPTKPLTLEGISGESLDSAHTNAIEII